MRGVDSEDLLALVDFFYSGEANIPQENLESFLKVAEELQLKGLMGKCFLDKSEEEGVENTSKQSQEIKPDLKKRDDFTIKICRQRQVRFKKTNFKI